jgi:hypothetical protein
MSDALDLFRFQAEHRMLELLTGIHLDLKDEEAVESADVPPEGEIALETFCRIGLFSEGDETKWRALVRKWGGDQVGPVDTEARKRAISYLDAEKEKLGEEAGPAEIRSFTTALVALKLAGLIGQRRYLDYRLRLHEHINTQHALEGAYEGAYYSEQGEGGFLIYGEADDDETDDSAEPDWAADLPLFRGRDLLGVVPGPLRTDCGLTVIGTELYSDGVIFRWQFVRSPDEPVEPASPPGLEPASLPGRVPDLAKWEEWQREEASFSGGDRITHLTDDVGTAYRLLFGGSEGWDANRPRVSFGSTTFTPGVPNDARRLMLDIAEVQVEISLRDPEAAP